MVELLNAIPNGVAGAGIAAAMFLALFTAMSKGVLVTRREHEGRVEDLKEQNAIQRATIEMQEETVRRALSYGDTLADGLEEIKRISANRGGAA